MFDAIFNVILNPIITHISSSFAALHVFKVSAILAVVCVALAWAAEACGEMDRFRKAWKLVKYLPMVVLFSTVAVSAYYDPIPVLVMVVAAVVLSYLVYSILSLAVCCVIMLGKFLEPKQGK